MRSIGIDIGSSSIKVVEMLTTSKGFQVVQCFDRPLAMNPNQDQEIEIIEILREISSRFDPATTRFCLCLRQDQVSIRHKVFPFSDRLKIGRSLAYELEEEIPFSSDNSIFDAKIIRTIGNTAEILACAAPKQHIKNLLQRCADSSIDPALISVEGMAFANVYERWNEAPPALPPEPGFADSDVKQERNINLVLNMGHTRTLITAFEGNSLIGIRTILWGAKNIAEAVARKYEIPFLDALQELQAKSFILTSKQGATFDQVTFSETIAKSVREMVRDMQLSILEFKSEFNAQILQIGITGGASNIKNLGPYLTQQLEVPVNKVYPMDLIPNVLFEKNARTDSIYGLALGLAIEGLKKPRNPAVTFLRGDFIKQNHSLRKMWEVWGPTAKLALTALLLFTIYSYYREDASITMVDHADEALVAQAKNVAHLPAKKANETNIKKFIRENKKRAADLKTLASVASMNSALDILKRVNDATPPKSQVTLDVKRIDVKDSFVALEGYVASPVELGRLTKSLGSVSIDGRVGTNKSGLAPMPGKVAFSLNFKVDRGITKTIQ